MKTQLLGQSGLRVGRLSYTANALAGETKRDDPISRYLDAVELDCE